MKQLSMALSVGLCLAAAVPAMAQRRDGARDSAKKAASIPTDARPPKGMCRIWIDGVPAAQQPAATDCPSAVKNRPANGRVIFGDDFADTSKKSADRPKLPPGVKGFTEIKTPIVLRKPE